MDCHAADIWTRGDDLFRGRKIEQVAHDFDERPSAGGRLRPRPRRRVRVRFRVRVRGIGSDRRDEGLPLLHDPPNFIEYTFHILTYYLLPDFCRMLPRGQDLELWRS